MSTWRSLGFLAALTLGALGVVLAFLGTVLVGIGRRRTR